MKYAALACFLMAALVAALNWHWLYQGWRHERQRQQNPAAAGAHYSMQPAVSTILFLLGWLMAGHALSLPWWAALLVLLDPSLTLGIVWALATACKTIRGC